VAATRKKNLLFLQEKKQKHSHMLLLDLMRYSARALALVYLGFALPWMIWFAVWVPPIQGPDEGAHLARADLISHGGFAARRLAPGVAGGPIDLGVIEVIRRFYMLPDHPDHKADPALYAPVPWGAYGNWNFPNTAIYPPVFYLPAAGALYAGRALGLDVLRSTELARLALGFLAVPSAALVIALSGPASIYLFTLLLLPSSVQLMTHITQDGGMLVSAAAVGVLFLRGRQWGLWIAAALLACIGSCRLPYAALSLLTLAWPGQSLPRRVAACAVAVLGAVAWITFARFYTYVDFPPVPEVQAAAQAALLLKHPFNLPLVIGHTVRLYFASDLAPYFVSLTKLPGFYTCGALLFLAFSLQAAWRRPLAARAAVWACAALAAAAGIFLLEYLTWTPVGSGEVWGVQGRYFLPIMATLPVCLTCLVPAEARTSPWVYPVLLAFPAVSICVTLWRILPLY
jgi:hypothetical protein